MEIEEEKPADEETGDMEVDQNGKRERCMLLPHSPLMCANSYLEPRGTIITKNGYYLPLFEDN